MSEKGASGFLRVWVQRSTQYFKALSGKGVWQGFGFVGVRRGPRHCGKVRIAKKGFGVYGIWRG